MENPGSADKEWINIRISSSAAPRKVGMAIDDSTGGIVGFRLLDKKGNTIVKE